MSDLFESLTAKEINNLVWNDIMGFHGSSRYDFTCGHTRNGISGATSILKNKINSMGISIETDTRKGKEFCIECLIATNCSNDDDEEQPYGGESECYMDSDGQCSMAGSEHCNWECPNGGC